MHQDRSLPRSLDVQQSWPFRGNGHHNKSPNRCDRNLMSCWQGSEIHQQGKPNTRVKMSQVFSACEGFAFLNFGIRKIFDLMPKLLTVNVIFPGMLMSKRL